MTDENLKLFWDCVDDVDKDTRRPVVGFDLEPTNYSALLFVIDILQANRKTIKFK